MVGRRVGARGPWGPLAPDVKVRGERIFHARIHLEQTLHGGLLAHSMGLGESRARGPWGPLGPDVKVRGERIFHERMHPT